jgi:methylmalonyl-CoA/ethylmalonyl-CoA epimerase
MIRKIDHLGIAVRSLSEAVKFYESALGLKCERQEEVASQKVRIAFLRVGEIYLELLEPTAPDSPIAKFLETRGEGLHHVAFHTDDIQGQLQQAAGAGCRLINEAPFEGGGGKLVAFLHPKTTHGVLTEFCSAPQKSEGEA